MTPYKNLGRDSGVVAYELGEDYIIVKFKKGRWTLYSYTYQNAGSPAIETMKQLAECGEGLNAYIRKNKPDYSSKI